MPFVSGKYRLPSSPAGGTSNPATGCYHLLVGRLWNVLAYRHDGETEKVQEWQEKAQEAADWLRDLLGEREAAAAISAATSEAKRWLAGDMASGLDWRSRRGRELKAR